MHTAHIHHIHEHTSHTHRASFRGSLVVWTESETVGPAGQRGKRQTAKHSRVSKSLFLRLVPRGYSMPNFGPVCDSNKSPPCTYACTYTCTQPHSFLTHAPTRTHATTHSSTHIAYSTLAHRKGQVSVVSDVQQPTPDDTQFAKRTSKNRRVECQTQDEKCSATDKQSDGW